MTGLVPPDFRSVFATPETVFKEIAVPAKVALRNDLRDNSSEGVVICGGRYHTNCLRVHCNSQTQGAVVPVQDMPSQAVVMRVDPEKYLQVAGRFNARDGRSIESRSLMVISIEQTLIDVWRQVLVENAEVVELGTERYPVWQTPKSRLRQVDFVVEGNNIRGLEQNPATKSRWAQMARSGHKVMQFLNEGRYVANVVDGKMTLYKR